VDELGALLGEVQSGQDVRNKQVFNLEVACKVDVVEFSKFFINLLSSPLLHE